MTKRQISDVGLKLLDVQTKKGAVDAYKGAGNGGALTTDAAGVNLLRLSYTPIVDAWWEVVCVIGLMHKIDAAYHYALPGIYLSSADADGSDRLIVYKMQHSGVQTFDHYVISKIWKLVAGTPYDCTPIFNSSGGTWEYNQGPTNLSIHGRAWAR